MWVVAARFGAMDVISFGPLDDLGYRRPPVTASFEDLRARGLPEVLFVHSCLPEGVTICDVSVFAAMIEEAYHTPLALPLRPADGDGNQQCQGLGGSGLGGWEVASRAGRTRTGTARDPRPAITLAPERDGQRQATVAMVEHARRHAGEVVGPVVATFPLSTRPAGAAPTGSPVELGPLEAMGGVPYRRPPATVSFDVLGRSALPRALFVNTYLPEGVTVVDLDVFAAMIEEAYHTPDALHMLPDLDEHGNEQCTGIGATGTWQWVAVCEGEPIDGERYTSPQVEIGRILFAPEADGGRVCTLVPSKENGRQWPQDNYPVTFTISVRPGPATALAPELSELADRAPAAADLLRLLAFLGPESLPLGLLLAGARALFAAPQQLPDPAAAAVISSLSADPAAAGHAVTVLRRFGLLSAAAGGREVIPRPVRAAIRAQLATQQADFWRQVGAAVIDAALSADPQAPASWPSYVALLPHAHATLDPTGDGMGRVARYLGYSGHYLAARDTCRQIADALTAHDSHGAEHPRTLAAHRQAARWTGMAGQASEARDQLTALLPVTERVLGPDHPDTLAARRELARWTGEAGDAAGAREQCVALWPAVERVLGGDHLDALAVRSELACWSGQAPDTPDARDQCAALLSIYELIAGPGNASVVLDRRMFPDVPDLEQAAASARYQFGLLHRIYERLLGGDHPDTFAVWGSQNTLFGDAGHVDHARTQFALLLQRSKRILGPGHPDILHTRHELARFTGIAGDAAEARDQLTALLPVTERVLGPDHPRTLTTRAGLAYWTHQATDREH